MPDDTAAHPLITAHRVNGTPVFNSGGERIGHIEDLSIDKRSGQVVYALLSFGGFLGIGEKFHPLPWSMLDYNPEQGGYVVSLSRQELEKAPTYELSDLISNDGAGKGPSFDYYSKFSKR